MRKNCCIIDIMFGIDFYLRNFFKYSKRGYFVPFGINYEAKWVEEFLEKKLQYTFNQDMKILDIGCKNWSYVEGIWTFFSKRGVKFQLNGIEIDAYRLNTEFYSREEVAKGYAKHLKNVKYIAGNFLKHWEKYDLEILILPFVFYEPHKKWGLPKKYFNPKLMLRHAYNCLNKGGRLIVVNQGEDEFIEQKRLYKVLGFEFEDLGEFITDNDVYKERRFVSLVSKPLN